MNATPLGCWERPQEGSPEIQGLGGFPGLMGDGSTLSLLLRTPRQAWLGTAARKETQGISLGLAVESAT